MALIINKYILSDWNDSIDWSLDEPFCLIAVVDSVKGNGSGIGEFVLSAAKAGVSAVYIWGHDADRAADHGVFTVSFEVATQGELSRMRDDLVVQPFVNVPVDRFVSLILGSYLPGALEGCSNLVLAVYGLRESNSLRDLLKVLSDRKPEFE